MNPISLLKEPLQPSRGMSSKIYTITNTDLGVFDLAGQENKIWLSDKGKEVFSESNIIICVFDIRDSLKSIIKFLIDIYKLKKDLRLDSCNIVAFLHKIDLRSNSYVYSKLKIIQEFITKQHPHGQGFNIYQTSITKDNFYNTYFIISELLRLLIKSSKIPITHEEIQKLKLLLSIILIFDIDVKYSIEELSQKFKINSKEAKLYIDEIEKLGFMERFDEYNYFKLTKRACYFKIGLKRDYNSMDQLDFNRKTEFFHIFLCLREKE